MPFLISLFCKTFLFWCCLAHSAVMVFCGGRVIDWKDNFANRVLQKLCTTHFWQSTNWCLSTIINGESPIRKKFFSSKNLFSCCRHFDVLDERANIVVGGSGYFVIRKRRAPPTKFVTQLVLSSHFLLLERWIYFVPFSVSCEFFISTSWLMNSKKEFFI